MLQPRFAAFAFAAALAAVSTSSAADNPVRISADSTRAALRKITTEPEISAYVKSVADRACRRFKEAGLTPDDLAIAVILDEEDRAPVMGGYNLTRPFYPASVVKLCYALALEQAFADGRIARTPEVLRDLDLMLRISSNAATNRILDLLTGTESGPELQEAELAEFAAKRQAVNEYLRHLGFRDINACQKTWDDAPFGRDMQFLGPNYENRNRMTAADTARLLWIIKRGKAVSRPACEEILKHIRRRPGDPKDIQARRIGGGVPPGSGLWSKAGWTSSTNHDAAYVELPIGSPFVLVVFTNTSYKYAEIPAWIASEIVQAIQLDRLRPEFTPATVRMRRPAGGR
jgi:beta-lactamase class A